MACVALTSLMATIELEFLIPNHRVCVDDEKPLNSLFDKLSSLQDFLQKEYNNGGAPIRDVEIKIRDFALKAEDAIEIQLRNILLAKHKEHGEIHQTLQELAKEAEELLIIINNISNEPASQPGNNVSGGSSQCSRELQDIMFGRFNEFIAIRTHFLLNDDSHPQRRVGSLYGVPGLGKTILCKKLYEDEEVISHFDIQAWVTIARGYNVQQVMCGLVQSMRPTVVNEIDMESTTVFQLKDQLYKYLNCKRYLIVLDDVSNTLLWDDIQQCFPDDSNGSRIVLTTRFCQVATYTSSVFDTMDFLNQNDSWDLFRHRLSRKQCMAPKFEEIAKRLVEDCQGLPRSVVMVANRLSKCNYTLKEWKKVEKELLSLGTLYTDTQHSSKLTEMYNQLPQHLKVCFLYFAVFPKGIEIRIEMLTSLWIAEGFVRPVRSVPLEDIAFKYLVKLIGRVLVNSDAWKTLDRGTCRIHNDMHSFCVQEAQKEGLLCVVNTRQCIGWSLDMLGNSYRWLGLRSHSLDYHVLFSSNIPRSLFFCQQHTEMIVPFKYLRVLYFRPSLVLKRVPLPLGDLVFLRYPSIPQWFESLEDVVSTKSNLQTLIVSGIDQSKLGAATIHLPSKIWEPQRLRHLKLGDMYMVDPPNMVKEHLQTLSWASPINFMEKGYCRFPDLRKLRIFYKDDILEPGCSHGSCGNPIIVLENFEDLVRLESLTVIVPVGSITLLERLVFPANLKKLSLNGTKFAMKVLRVIGELPKLKVLKLDNGFYGRVWEVAEGAFHALKTLILEARNLERWVVNTCHFPKLKSLVLRRCYFLEEIPPCFAQGHLSLLLIQLDRCSPSVVASGKWIQQERFRNEINVTHLIVDGNKLHPIYP